MEKTIIVGGKELKLKSTAAFMLKYKAQFRKDPLQEVMKLQKAEDIDIELLYNLVWALAKTADNSIKEPTEFFDEYENLPLLDEGFMNEIVDMVLGSMGASVQPKKPSNLPKK